MRIIPFCVLSLLFFTSVRADSWLVLNECDPKFPTVMLALSTTCAQTPNGWQYINVAQNTAALYDSCQDSRCSNGCTKEVAYNLQPCSGSGFNASINYSAATGIYKQWIAQGYGVSIEYQSTTCGNPYRMVARPLQKCYWDEDVSAYSMDICDYSQAPPFQTYRTTKYVDPACTEEVGPTVSYTGGTCTTEEAAIYLCPNKN
jgi:hypothetical protein